MAGSDTMVHVSFENVNERFVAIPPPLYMKERDIEKTVTYLLYVTFLCHLFLYREKKLASKILLRQNTQVLY